MPEAQRKTKDTTMSHLPRERRVFMCHPANLVVARESEQKAVSAQIESVSGHLALVCEFSRLTEVDKRCHVGLAWANSVSYKGDQMHAFEPFELVVDLVYRDMARDAVFDGFNTHLTRALALEDVVQHRHDTVLVYLRG